MYLGRFLIVGPAVAAYRVSSRSFPNRQITARDETTYAVGPTPAAPEPDNPYVRYNCLRIDDPDRAVIGNGAHVDAIYEKLARGYPPRDATVEILHAFDYERDEYDTPRIAGVITAEAAVLGIVRADALLVTTVEEPHLVATYERTAPEPFAFEMADGAAAAQAAYDLDFDHPVAAVGLVSTAAAFDVGIVNDGSS